MISTPRTASLVIAPAFAVLAAASWLSAGEVAATKDGITITAEASAGLPGKTRISCTLTNHSPHPLASVHPRSPCPCFQFKLLDAKGNRVPQEREWSEGHRQDDLNFSDDDRIGLIIRGQRSYRKGVACRGDGGYVFPCSAPTARRRLSGFRSKPLIHNLL